MWAMYVGDVLIFRSFNAENYRHSYRKHGSYPLLIIHIVFYLFPHNGYIISQYYLYK